MNQKTQVLAPAKLGSIIFEIVRATVPDLLSPKMTASWEKGLEGIANGTIPAPVYREKLENFIKSEVAAIKDGAGSEKLMEVLKEYGFIHNKA